MGQSGRLILIDLKMRCPGSSPTSDWYAHTHWYIPPSGFRSCEKKKGMGNSLSPLSGRTNPFQAAFAFKLSFRVWHLCQMWMTERSGTKPLRPVREREKKELIFFFPLTVSDDESPGTLPWFFTSAVLCAGVYVVVPPVISRDSSLLSPPLGSHDVITFDPPGRRERGLGNREAKVQQLSFRHFVTLGCEKFNCIAQWIRNGLPPPPPPPFSSPPLIREYHLSLPFSAFQMELNSLSLAHYQRITGCRDKRGGGIEKGVVIW